MYRAEIVVTLLYSLMSFGCCQEIEFPKEPKDVSVAIGTDAFFPCIIIDAATNDPHFPAWKIYPPNCNTPECATLFHPRASLSYPYVNNGSGLIVEDVNTTMDGSSYACCLEILFQLEGDREICSERGKLRIIITCDTPEPPINGTIDSYNNTVRGANITFHCDEGYFPDNEMVSVCTLEKSGIGLWKPEPSLYNCSGLCAYIKNDEVYRAEVSEIEDTSVTVTVICNFDSESVDLPLSISIVLEELNPLQDIGNTTTTFNVTQRCTELNRLNLQNLKYKTAVTKFAGLNPNTTYSVLISITSPGINGECLLSEFKTGITSTSDSFTLPVYAIVLISIAIFTVLIVIFSVVCYIIVRVVKTCRQPKETEERKASETEEARKSGSNTGANL